MDPLREWRLIERMLVGDFNPYHDPKNGRFTTGSSTGAYAPIRGKTENGQRLLEKYRESHKEDEGQPVPRTSEQEKTLKKLFRQAAKLKNEQYWIISPDGSMPIHTKGKGHEVGARIGDKRDHLKGAISLHNHPVGGSFSDEDLDEFGFGATEMLVVGRDGVYSLANNRVGKKDQYEGWHAMREELRKQMPEWELSFTELTKRARKNLENTKVKKDIDKISQKWAERKDAGATQEELKAIADEYGVLLEEYKKRMTNERRRLEVAPYHEFYKKNAKKYGFTYTFTESKDNPYRALEQEV